MEVPSVSCLSRFRSFFLCKWRLCIICIASLVFVLTLASSAQEDQPWLYGIFFNNSTALSTVVGLGARASASPVLHGSSSAPVQQHFDVEDAFRAQDAEASSKLPELQEMEFAHSSERLSIGPESSELRDMESPDDSSDVQDTESTEVLETNSVQNEISEAQDMKTPEVLTTLSTPASSYEVLASDVHSEEDEGGNEEKHGSVPLQQCDVSVGSWVYDQDHYPLYSPASCPFVDEAFSCQKNGRPDTDYLKWRWQPKDCKIPRFNAQSFLEKIRNKRLVFAGDSLMRNQWESMLCLLREGVANKSHVFEARGVRITKGRGDYVFKFSDYNAKVEFYRSHFLVAEGRQRKPDSRRSRLTLRLDAVDRTSKKWRQADIIVFTTGHWWNHGKTSKGKDYFQEGDTVHEILPVMVAFRKAMTTWGSWVDKSLNPKRTKVFFSGYSPSHFHGGLWNTGGQCSDEKEPIFNESYIPSYSEKMQIIEDVVRQMKVPVQILNITRFTEYRKDGHPSIYGQVPDRGGKRRQDCSHWCLPGVPDIWNELLQAFL